MLVQADLRQFPAHSERHEKNAEHVVIEVAHAGCLRRRDAARPCEAAVPCISVICTTAARASGPARTATIVALCAGWYIYEIGALPGRPNDKVCDEQPTRNMSARTAGAGSAHQGLAAGGGFEGGFEGGGQDYASFALLALLVGTVLYNAYVKYVVGS